MSENAGAVEPADLDHLRALLARLEELWVERDTVTLRYLRPGLSDEEIDAATARLGLVLPVEAREWFRWHDGVNRNNDDRASLLAAYFGPPLGLRTLAECAEYTEFQREAVQAAREVGIDPDYAWPPSWFSLAEAGNGDPVIVDCGVPPGAVTPIRTTDWTDVEAQRLVRVNSLTELIATWIQLIEEGVYSYDHAQGFWHYHYERLTSEQIMAALY